MVVSAALCGKTSRPRTVLMRSGAYFIHIARSDVARATSISHILMAWASAGLLAPQLLNEFLRGA